MFDDPVDLSRALFDSSLVYLIIGLIVFVALLGLLILLGTSCCCFYCFVYSASTCLCCCYHHRRRYSLNSVNKQPRKRARLRRRASDLTDFSQLYDSCPHLINSKATITFVSSPALNSVSIHESLCPNIYETVPPIYETPLSVGNLPRGEYFHQDADSMRRTTILTRLKDDAAFLY